MILTVVANAADGHILAALATVGVRHDFRAGRTRLLKLMARFASFSNP